MPIYDYKCKECGETFELLVGIGSGENVKECKNCGSQNIAKQVSAFDTKSSNSREPNASTGSSCATGTCPF